MRIICFVFLTLLTQSVFGQRSSVIYHSKKKFALNHSTSNGRPYFEPKVNEITLNNDSTFEFWSRPDISCFTWQQYKGTWRKVKDTIVFANKYEVVEADAGLSYNKDDQPRYHIAFFTDKKSKLISKDIKIQFVYDYDAHLADFEKPFVLNDDNAIDIPFKDIANPDKLASLRVEYVFNTGQKRFAYLNTNNFINKREGPLPNVISVMFIEKPQTEIVQRTIKGLICGKSMVILSTTKSKITLKDYHSDIAFEDSYALDE